MVKTMRPSLSIPTRLTVLFLGGVLALSTLSGCGGDDEVTFAAILPLSGGPLASYGTEIKRGIELAFEEAKTNPDYPYQVELQILDTESDPQRAVELLEQVYDEGAIAAIGGVTSDAAMKMVEVADDEDRILISPSASTPRLTGASRNFFRVFPSDHVEGTKMGSFAANNLKLERVVIVAAESPYGRGIQGVFKNEFERHGGEVVETIEYPPNTSDFSGIIDRVVTLDPDAVYLVDYWRELVQLIEGLHEVGYDGKILTTSAFATSEAVEAAGDAAEGVYFTQTVFDVSSEAEPIRGFVEEYREDYGEDPGLYAAHGYDAMRVLLEALRQAGSTLPSELYTGMKAITSFPGVTGSLQFDEQGDVQKFPRIYVITDGAPINYEEHVQKIREAFRERLRELERQQEQLGRPN